MTLFCSWYKKGRTCKRFRYPKNHINCNIER